MGGDNLSLVSKGVSTCAGCGLELIIRHILGVLGPNTIIVIPPGCAALFSGFGDNTALKIAGFQGNLENSAAYAAGIKAGLEMQGKDTNVLVLAGDGATVDIGLQSLSGMMERGDRVLYVCYDNEAYMNTGIQGSGSTPIGAWTSTTPTGKFGPRKNMLEIAAAHHIPYAASASAGYLKDLRRKVEIARRVNGPSYIHVQTPCPTGWFFDPDRTIDVARLAVQTGVWPLYEIIDGQYHLNQPSRLKPLKKFLELQGRFSHLTDDDIKVIQLQVSNQYQKLKEKQAG